jgi:hypothetical protein
MILAPLESDDGGTEATLRLGRPRPCVLAAILILSVSTRGPVEVLGLIAGFGVLYGSYLIFRGKSSLLFGRAKTRTRAVINLLIGLVTLLLPGGIRGTASILAIVSAVFGLLAA